MAVQEWPHNDIIPLPQHSWVQPMRPLALNVCPVCLSFPNLVLPTKGNLSCSRLPFWSQGPGCLKGGFNGKAEVLSTSAFSVSSVPRAPSPFSRRPAFSLDFLLLFKYFPVAHHMIAQQCFAPETPHATSASYTLAFNAQVQLGASCPSIQDCCCPCFVSCLLEWTFLELGGGHP